MKWFKCSNTIALNPKLGIVAQSSKSYKHEVLALWVYLLAEASRHNEKGNLGNLDLATCDYALDFTPGKSEKVFNAFIAKGMIANNAIIGWQEYQADPTNAQRQKKYREKTKGVSKKVTESNSYVTENNAVTVEEKRVDKIRIEDLSISIFSESELEMLSSKFPAVDITELIETLKDWCLSKGKTYKDYKAAIRTGAKKEQEKQNATIGQNTRQHLARNKNQLSNSPHDIAGRGWAAAISTFEP